MHLFRQNKPSYVNDTASEEDILNKLQHQAKVLKELGGELPPELEKLVEKEDEPDGKKAVSGFTLVAGYGSDLDETDEEVDNLNSNPGSLFPIAPQLPQSEPPRSTLFPVVEPIDVGQFLESNQDNPKPAEEKNNTVDVKAFQRKRKIGIDLVNAQKRVKPEEDANERKGFGFKSAAAAEYPGFKSGGVMFVKSDTLNANDSEKSAGANVPEEDKGRGCVLSRDFEETRNTLSEKLGFLSEVHNPVPPVQVMLIQIEVRKKFCYFIRH